jgi:transposase InsO family protein
MTDSHTLYKINNYYFTDELIDEVIEELKDKSPKYGKWAERYEGFTTRENKLYYNNIEVARDSDKEKYMQKLYDDPTQGVGVGIRQFYYKVVHHYLNIKRYEVAEFLKKQKNYQISRNTSHLINKPILTSQPNERYSIDLVDMNRYKSQNRDYRYILTCIDCFSRYVWAKPIKTKSSRDVTQALKSICEETGVYPHIIMKDNGKEFQGATNAFMKQHNIIWINTLSYSPQSNGLIENFNNQLRKILRELMIRNNNTIWYNKLQIACDNKNTQRNSTIKDRPANIWKPIPYNPNLVVVDDNTMNSIERRAKENVEKNKTVEYEIGSLVRVKLLALYSQIRQMIKQGDKKFLIVKYTPEVYRIRHILKPDKEGYEKLRYTIETLQGEPVLTQLKRNNPNAERREKRFFATDFLPVTKEWYETEKDDGFTIHKALKLNNVRDEETEMTKPKKQKKKATPAPAPEPITREPRIRRANQMLNNSYLENTQEYQRMGKSVVIGGKIYFYTI